MTVLKLILGLLRSMSGSRVALAAENLALRQQLAVLRRSVNRQNPSYAIGHTDAFFGMDTPSEPSRWLLDAARASCPAHIAVIAQTKKPNSQIGTY